MIARTEAGLHEPTLLGREQDSCKTSIGEDEVRVLRSLTCCGADFREAHVNGLMNVQAPPPVIRFAPTSLYRSRASGNLLWPRQIDIHHLGQNLFRLPV